MGSTLAGLTARLGSLFRDCLWIVVAPMAILVVAVISFELFIFFPQDMERLLLIDGVPTIAQERLIAVKSGELPRRVIYLGASLIYTVTFFLGCLFYFFVIRSGLCRSHSPQRLLQQPTRRVSRADIAASDVVYVGTAVLSSVLFIAICLWAEDIRFIHHEIHQDLFKAVHYEIVGAARPYFDGGFQEWLGLLTPAHYLMGFVSGALTLLAFAATAAAPKSSVDMEEHWQSQVQRLQYVAFAGSFIILTGIILMGSRFQWTTEIVGGAIQAKEAIASYPTVVVAYWAVVMSLMLLVTYLTVVWRLFSHGAQLSLGTELRSAMALFAPVAGSVVTAIF